MTKWELDHSGAQGVVNRITSLSHSIPTNMAVMYVQRSHFSFISFSSVQELAHSHPPLSSSRTTMMSISFSNMIQNETQTIFLSDPTFVTLIIWVSTISIHDASVGFYQILGNKYNLFEIKFIWCNENTTFYLIYRISRLCFSPTTIEHFIVFVNQFGRYITGLFEIKCYYKLCKRYELIQLEKLSQFIFSVVFMKNVLPSSLKRNIFGVF